MCSSTTIIPFGHTMYNDVINTTIKDVESRLKEKQEGEARIMPLYFLHLITIALCSLCTLRCIIALIRWLDKLVLVL